MLVVGFAVAYAGVGGPRFTGVANGLQLFYVLPCFPPYDPPRCPSGSSGSRSGSRSSRPLTGCCGPRVAPVPFRMRLADAVDAVGRYVAGLPADGPREAAEAAVTASAARAACPRRCGPTGPGAATAGSPTPPRSCARWWCARACSRGCCPTSATPPRGRPPTPCSRWSATRSRACAAALRGTGPPPESGPLAAGVADYLEGRAERIADRLTGDELPPWCGSAGSPPRSASAARGLVAAVRAGTGAPPDTTAAPASAWYLGMPTAVLWWRRLAAHFTPRSVYFQNAVRLALGLAAARLARRPARPLPRVLGAAGDAVPHAHLGSSRAGSR